MRTVCLFLVSMCADVYACVCRVRVYVVGIVFCYVLLSRRHSRYKWDEEEQQAKRFNLYFFFVTLVVRCCHKLGNIVDLLDY